MSPPTLFAPDVWLGEIMGRPAFRVTPDAAPVDELSSLVADHARVDGKKGAFYYAKVGSRRLDVVRALTGAGFFVTDVNVTFERSAAESDLPTTEVRECTAGDEDAVCEIAGTTFEFTRFHLDPLMPPGVANTVKREWVRNCVRKKRGDRVFVAVRDGKPVAFLAALVTEKSAVIDLVGVDRAHQRARVGSAIVNAFIAHYRQTHGSLLVGTQVANVPSIRLYERLGFSLCKSEYVLHMHSRG